MFRFTETLRNAFSTVVEESSSESAMSPRAESRARNVEETPLATLQYDLTASMAVMNHAESMSPGVASRVSAQDYCALFNGFARVYRDAYHRAEPLPTGATIPKLHITPPVTYLEVLSRSIDSSGLRIATTGNQKVPPTKPLKSKGSQKEKSGEQKKAKGDKGGRQGQDSASKNKRDLAAEGDRRSVGAKKGVTLIPKKPKPEAEPKKKAPQRETSSNPLPKLKQKAIAACLRSLRSKSSGTIARELGVTEEGIREFFDHCEDVDLLQGRKNSGLPPLSYFGFVKRDQIRDWGTQADLDDAEEKASTTHARSRERQAAAALAGSTKPVAVYYRIPQRGLDVVSRSMDRMERMPTTRESCDELVRALHKAARQLVSYVPAELKQSRTFGPARLRPFVRDGRHLYQLTLGTDTAGAAIRCYCSFSGEGAVSLYESRPETTDNGRRVADLSRYGEPCTLRAEPADVDRKVALQFGDVGESGSAESQKDVSSSDNGG